MQNRILAIILVGVCAACGGKPKVVIDSTNPLGAVVGAAGAMAASADEAQKFLDARKAKGDTVAMNYKDLEGFLPTSIAGYAADGGASGQQSNMGAFSISTAEQKWISSSDSNARIHVTIADYSGSAAGYGMMAPYMAMNISSEDDHHKSGTVQIAVPYTFGIGEYNKDNHDAKMTVGTRYRYFITVEATGQQSDQSKLVESIATDIAKSLTGK